MRIRISFSLFICLFFGIQNMKAQLPKTDLYMVTILNNGERISIKNPVYVSGFNPNGYNNQPSFINPAQLYITSNHYDRSFTDFMRLDLQSERYFRVTATDSISEFSPTPVKGLNSFSAVRIEKDNKTQTLWLYPSDHSGPGKRLFTEVDNIGYHCWLSDNTVAMFLVDEPMKLYIGDVADNSVALVMENIGRGMKRNRNGHLVFVHKILDDKWLLKTYNPQNKKAEVLIETPGMTEDFELLPDGTIVMGVGSKLYKYNAAIDSEWDEVGDLSEYGIMNITRLASSRNRLILVDTPE